MNRRTLVLSAGGAMLAQAAPSEQLNAGIIGSGGRGRFLMGRFARDVAVQLTAVCDVYEPNLEKGFQAALVIQMANLSLETGRRIKWNAQTLKAEA
jgi:hypothetical protein